jgi:hypothetical protein
MFVNVAPENLNALTLDNNAGKIQHINQLSPLVEYLRNKKVVAAFDWDNCISLTNGCNLPLRDPNTTINSKYFDQVANNQSGENTVEFFNLLNDFNVNWFILTARMRGDGYKEIENSYKFDDISPENINRKISHCIGLATHSIWEALPPFNYHNYSMLSPLFTNDNVIELKHTDIIKQKEHTFTTCICNNIVYAGSSSKHVDSNKGKALIRLMIYNLLPSVDDFD